VQKSLLISFISSIQVDFLQSGINDRILLVYRIMETKKNNYHVSLYNKEGLPASPFEAAKKE